MITKGHAEVGKSVEKVVGLKHYEIGVVAVMVLHIREPSLGDISRTSHSDERYIANHYALPLRQAIPIKAFAGEEI